VTDENNDIIARAAKKVHDAIDAAGVVPAEGRNALHDLAGRAQDAAHAVVASDAVRNLADRAEHLVRDVADRAETVVDDVAGRAETVVTDVTDRAETVVHDVTDRAEAVVHDVTDRAESAAETVALVAMETVDELRRRYRRGVRIGGAVGVGVIALLVIAVLRSRRR
jgi:replicative DNA helicase